MNRRTASKAALFLLVISVLVTAFFAVTVIYALCTVEYVPPIIVAIDLLGVSVLVDYHYFSCYKHLKSPTTDDVRRKKELQSRSTLLAAIMAGTAFCALLPLLYFVVIYRAVFDFLIYFAILAAVSAVYAVCTLPIIKAI